MIGGLWANDGMNDDKGSRQNAIMEIEESFQEAVGQVLAGTGSESQEEEIDYDNPFFAPVQKAMERLEGVTPQQDAETVQAVIEQQQDFTRFIDQS
jgi:hypothetical protein